MLMTRRLNKRPHALTQISKLILSGWAQTRCERIFEAEHSDNIFLCDLHDPLLNERVQCADALQRKHINIPHGHSITQCVEGLMLTSWTRRKSTSTFRFSLLARTLSPELTNWEWKWIIMDEHNVGSERPSLQFPGLGQHAWHQWQTLLMI